MNEFYKPSTHHILHVDGDSFFASCEVAINPALRGKAVVTGGDRGIASAMTYEAKAKGITRGMPIFQIRKFHPEVTIVSSDYDLYSLFSRRMVNIVRRYTEDVYEYSIDECFADITSVVEKRAGDAMSVGRDIKHDLQNELGMTFSLGIAPTKVLAKIASKTQKPDGLTVISHSTRKKFLENVPIQKVWGIGRQTSSFLFSKKIKTALEFSDMREDIIKSLVAKPYYEIYLELNGISISPSSKGSRESSKSVSRTGTFSPASSDPVILLSELSGHVEEACHALRRENLVSGATSFFLKDQNFQYYRVEANIEHRTSSPEEILPIIKRDFQKIYKKGLIYRATGVTLMDVREKEKYTPDLFGVYFATEKRLKLYEVIDNLLRKQGNEIHLASSLRAKSDKSNRRTSFIDHLPFPYLGEVN